MKPTVNVLYLPGTNCHAETLRAFAHVGASPRLLFLFDVTSGKARLDDADILCIPGGFSFGDHLGAGAVAGLLLRTQLADQFDACQDRPILGICNGFQIIVRAGCFGSNLALKTNASGTFYDQPDQRHMVPADNDSPWLAGLGGEVLKFPCAHGEGRLIHNGSEDTREWRPALHYPDGANPDGSTGGIAGITSTNGLIFGLMNHPERARDPHVRLAFFENGVRAAGASRR
ncbi:MAG: phosphoribosylformylglycinamidine synthase subunit PurQ [Pseudonocardiaceae bacterium]